MSVSVCLSVCVCLAACVDRDVIDIEVATQRAGLNYRPHSRVLFETAELLSRPSRFQLMLSTRRAGDNADHIDGYWIRGP